MIQIFETDSSIGISFFNVLEIHIGKYFVKCFINIGE
jgi:hypothetical protein